MSTDILSTDILSTDILSTDILTKITCIESHVENHTSKIICRNGHTVENYNFKTILGNVKNLNVKNLLLKLSNCRKGRNVENAKVENKIPKWSNCQNDQVVRLCIKIFKSYNVLTRQGANFFVEQWRKQVNIENYAYQGREPVA